MLKRSSVIPDANRPLANKLSAAAALGIAATLAAVVTLSTNSSSAKEHDFSVRSVISANLTDHHGHKLSASDFKNKLVMMNFFFTSCGSACPVQTSVLREVRNSIDPAINIEFISVSIAPMLDTQEAIERYIEKFDVEESNWHFVTASAKDTTTLTEQFGVSISNSQTDDEQVDHRNMGYLFGKNGELMQQYQLVPTVSKRLAREITELNQLDLSTE